MSSNDILQSFDICLNTYPRVISFSKINEIKLVIGFYSNSIQILRDYFDVKIDELFSSKYIEDFQGDEYDDMCDFYELNEEDIQYIISLLTKKRQNIEEHKYKILQENITIDPYTSLNPIPYIFKNDIIESDVLQVNERLTQINSIITDFQHILKLHKNASDDIHYLIMFQEARQKYNEWSDTKEYVLDKLDELRKKREFFKSVRVYTLELFVQFEKLIEDEKYWEIMLKRVDEPIRKYKSITDKPYKFKYFGCYNTLNPILN